MANSIIDIKAISVVKTYPDNYSSQESASDKEPRFYVALSWDDVGFDFTFFTSSEDVVFPEAWPFDVVHNCLVGLSGTTQKINPDIATSTIGSVSFDLIDINNSITEILNEKLTAGKGLRGKIVRLYVGYNDMPIGEYDLRLTYIIDSVEFIDSKYSFRLSDVQRVQKHKIFTPDETTLNSSINSTTMIIPVVSVEAGLFPSIMHGNEWSVRPNEDVGYIKIKDEVICHSGGIFFDTTNGWHIIAIERGALNTAAAIHQVSDNTEDSRKPKVIEHVYLEGASPKIIYALLTGILLNGNSPENLLPDHWHLGISEDFVRLSDFQNVGVDLWNQSTGAGRRVRIENPGKQEGKRYIEKEMLLWMGCFMPIYSTGELGLRKLAGVLSDSSYLAVLDKDNIKKYSKVTNDMRSVINDIRVSWNWVDSKEAFTKENLFIDAESISKHGVSDEKTFTFKTVHTGLHTDEDLLTYFDVLRDRYSGPPLLLNLSVMPSFAHLEVGDVVRVTLDQIYDFNTGSTLDRAFEVQQVTTNWMTGAVSLSLFGSSQKASEVSRTTLASVLTDSFYTGTGTDLSSVLTIVSGVVTVNGALTGHADDVDDSTAVYYYDGDLTIGAGVTVTVTENVQFRIKGSFLINGTISGVGNGATGGVATSQFVGGGVSDTWQLLDTLPGGYDALKDIEYNEGEQGYFGSTLRSPALAFGSGGGGAALAHSDGVSVGAPLSFGLGNDFVQASIKPGTVDMLPFYQLTNDQQTNTVDGYPSDLRGNSGSGGEPMLRSGYNYPNYSATKYLLANGGVGGNGGAGLLIVARGMSFGVAGSVDLSGGDSGVGGSQTYVPTGKTFYAGSGAPGAPGALVVLLDGQVTNPDITSTKFIANFGSVGLPGSATVVHRVDDDSVSPAIPGVYQYFQTASGSWYAAYSVGGAGAPSRPWPYNNAIYNGSYLGATQDINVFSAAHRIQYIPPDETPVSDDSNFPYFSVGKFNDLLFHLRDAVPVANTGFGRSVDVLDDGSRFIVGSFSSTVTRTVSIVRSISNPVREVDVLDPATSPTGSGWGDVVQISDDGSRFMGSASSAKPSTLTAQGEIYIYSRSGVTWTQEQILAAPSPVAFGFFGNKTVLDGAFEHLLADHSAVSAEIQYWTRSGLVWSYQNTLPVPAGVGAGFMAGGAFYIAALGEFAIVGDRDRTVDGVADVGAAIIYKRTGTNWAVFGDPLIPVDGLAYKWGLHNLINGDGAAIVIVSSVLSSLARMAVYHRAGDSFNLIQVLEFATSSSGVQLPSISDDGLTLIVYDSQIPEAFIFRRGSVEQGFKRNQILINQDDGVWGNTESFSLSSKGQYLITGNTSTDVGATNAGSIHAHQFVLDNNQ